LIFQFASQQIPFWTGYNSGLSVYKSEFSVVSYARIIESKPNAMLIVFTTMKRCVDMTKAMGQVHSVQTFDQQLYATAKQVEWAIPETFRDHTVRLGGFHTLSCYIATIGKLWGDGGLKDLLVDSPDTWLKVALNTNKTGQHVIRYTGHIVESR
jgi:hypothetical protein